MNYEIIEVINPTDGDVSEHVIITHDDDSMESFPVDENNPRYIQFLEEIA